MAKVCFLHVLCELLKTLLTGLRKLVWHILAGSTSYQQNNLAWLWERKLRQNKKKWKNSAAYIFLPNPWIWIYGKQYKLAIISVFKIYDLLLVLIQLSFFLYLAFLSEFNVLISTRRDASCCVLIQLFRNKY